jgi:SAM-dependent methyltransferase
MPEFTYVGSELDLFAAATRWKAYWSSQIRPYIKGDVLEVGAGLGSNTPFLDSGKNRRWVCLEPDAELVATLSENQKKRGEAPREIIQGTLADLDADQKFDTLVYIDVLEHIENDGEELRAAAARLRDGGRIVVLSPAHPWLFTPFDAAIGHYRRYTRRSLRSISPHGLRVERLFYLDSAGMLLSMGNRLLLRQSMPTKAQLHVWDTYVVPVSRVLDPCLLNLIGKTVVGVWRR